MIASGDDDRLRSAVVEKLRLWKTEGTRFFGDRDATPFALAGIVYSKDHVEKAVPELLKMGLIDPDLGTVDALVFDAFVEACALLAYEAMWGRNQVRPADIDVQILVALGNTRPFGFDTEGVCENGDYAYLIAGFSGISQGEFSPSGIIDHVRDHGRTWLEFVHSGRRYRLEWDGDSKWVDCASLLQTINQIMRDLGRSRRFWDQETGGQDSRIWFLTEDQAAGLSRRGWVLNDGDSILGADAVWYESQARALLRTARTAIRVMIDNPALASQMTPGGPELIRMARVSIDQAIQLNPHDVNLRELQKEILSVMATVERRD